MYNLKELAQELTSLSSLMIGKEKMALEDIADGETVVTINGVDVCEMDEEQVAVFTTEEYPTKFCFGGIALKNLILDICTKTNKTVEEVNEMFMEQPLGVIFERAKTKKNRDITKIKIV